MILKNDDLWVTIENTIFRAKKTSTNPQFVLDPDALQGFYDGVNVKRNETVRPNQWGDFREKGLLGARRMTLTGTAVANSPSQLLDMRDQFTGLLIHGGFAEISVKNSTGERFITAGLDSTPVWIQKLDTVAIWKIDLYAPDPRMYGRPSGVQLTDGTVTSGMDYPMDYPVSYGTGIEVPTTALYNNGNTYAWPIFIVTGDFFQGFTITNNAGSNITYDGVVTMTAPVTIDTGEGVASQGGVDKSILLSRRDWFSIPPNGSIKPRFLPKQDAVGWCDILYRDTWI